MKRRKAFRVPEEHRGEPPASRDDVRLRWVSDGWLWGPICPQDHLHGGLIDLQGSSKWYCRHQGHMGRGVYTEDELIDIEWGRITSVAQSQEISPLQSEEHLP